MKHAPSRVLEVIGDIFNNGLREEAYQMTGKRQEIAQILKKKIDVIARIAIQNYRGISVTSSMG